MLLYILLVLITDRQPKAKRLVEGWTPSDEICSSQSPHFQYTGGTIQQHEKKACWGTNQETNIHPMYELSLHYIKRNTKRALPRIDLLPEMSLLCGCCISIGSSSAWLHTRMLLRNSNLMMINIQPPDLSNKRNKKPFPGNKPCLSTSPLLLLKPACALNAKITVTRPGTWHIHYIRRTLLPHQCVWFQTTWLPRLRWLQLLDTWTTSCESHTTVNFLPPCFHGPQDLPIRSHLLLSV